MTEIGVPQRVEPAAVLVDNVSRRFTRGRSLWGKAVTVDALREVSLKVSRGSRFGVVGESGSGKTTLMRLIAGLDRPTSGRILVGGTEITGLPESRLGFLRDRLQVVFQDPMGSLDPRMRVGQIVAEPLRAQRKSDIAGTVARCLEQVGLDAAAARRYPHQFSGGQRQRISIARAIAPDPEILIADEAVSALDVTVRATILQLLDRIAAERDLTLIFVSHDLSVIRRVCDQVAVLRLGQLVEQGPTEQVYTSPQQDYTKALLEAVPVLSRSLELARARQHKRDGAGVAEGSTGGDRTGGGA